MGHLSKDPDRCVTDEGYRSGVEGSSDPQRRRSLQPMSTIRPDWPVFDWAHVHITTRPVSRRHSLWKSLGEPSCVSVARKVGTVCGWPSTETRSESVPAKTWKSTDSIVQPWRYHVLRVEP